MSGDGGRSALVTGAAGGLGLAIAKRLAADGCRVALADIDGEGAVRAAAELGGAAGYACDVTSEDSVGEMLGQFEAAFGGPPDILVNNAGIVRFGDLLEQHIRSEERQLFAAFEMYIAEADAERAGLEIKQVLGRRQASVSDAEPDTP